MRLDKLTLKAQESIQTAQQLAEKFGHQQIEPEHLLRAALDQTDGPIPPILGKIGANQEQILSAIEAALEKIPRVSGTGYAQAYISPRSNLFHSGNEPCYKFSLCFCFGVRPGQSYHVCCYFLRKPKGDKETHSNGAGPSNSCSTVKQHILPSLKLILHS